MNISSRKILSATVLLAAGAALAFIARGEVVVEVDYTRASGEVKRAGSGFLHPLPDPASEWHHTAEDLETFFWPLKPRFVRTGSQNVPHYIKLMPDLPLVATLGDGWGYATRGKPAKYPPYKDWKAWEAYVERTVQAAVDAGARRVIWDAWNEPNIREWWGDWTDSDYAPGWEEANFENFCELYRRTHEVVRRVDPNAKMTGPSLAYVERPDDGYRWMIAFRDYVVEHKCVPDFWNWHFGGETIPRFAAEFSAWRLNEGCLIPEYLGPEQSKRPGRVAFEAILLDHAEVSGAMKANWARNDQFRGSINGLILRDQEGKFRKRGMWWVYRTLAEMDGAGKVEGRSSNDRIAALAALQKDGSGLILLGNSYTPRSRGTGSQEPLDPGYTGAVRLRIKLPGDFPGGRLLLDRIPYADYGPVDRLPRTEQVKDITPAAEAVEIVVPWENPDDAWRIALAPGVAPRAEVFTEPARVTVDFGRSLGPVRRAAAGFLHPLPDRSSDWHHTKEDLERFFWAIKPTMVRTGSQNVPHYVKIMPETPLVATLGDGWGYARRSRVTKGPPYLQWEAWEDYVEQTVKAAVDAGARHMIWDAWNEPNLDSWFGGWSDNSYAEGWEGASFEQFCELYRRTHRVVRKVDPRAKITAPSFGYPEKDWAYIERFRDYVVRHECVPDYWNWHFGGDNIPWLADRFAAWNLNEGSLIPEYLGPELSRRPGRVAFEVILIENARNVTGAMKASWSRYDQFRGSINGLILRDGNGGFQPRGMWWVYRTLAGMDGAMKVTAESSSERVNVLAGLKGRQGVVLLGNSFAPRSSGTGTDTPQNPGFAGKVLVSLQFPGGMPASRVTLQRISYADYGPVVELPAPDSSVELKAGARSAELTIDWQDGNDAWSILLGPAG